MGHRKFAISNVLLFLCKLAASWLLAASCDLSTAEDKLNGAAKQGILFSQGSTYFPGKKYSREYSFPWK